MEEKTSRHGIIKDLGDYIIALIGYLLLRIRQLVIYLWAFVIYCQSLGKGLKSGLVKRMFWGRSTFYRTAFQLGVTVITILLGIGGLTGRLDLFVPKVQASLTYPSEQLGDADYLPESGSINSIVTSSTLTRDFAVQTYIVQKGDTLASIADAFGVSTDTIRWENGISGDYIKVGQELRILPINGLIYTVKKGDTLESIAKTYSASVQDIYDINWLDLEALSIGQRLLIPDGTKPQPKPVAKPIIAQVPNAPVYNFPAGGAVGTGSFIRPVNCGSITQYFSARHGAVDIAGGGCTVMAADTGVVVMARWAGNGGLQIMINHGNGFVTLYAHNAQLYIKEGQNVVKGQPIGYMGRTGHASGVHLHFGVQLNGVWVNPLSYVPI